MVYRTEHIEDMAGKRNSRPIIERSLQAAWHKLQVKVCDFSSNISSYAEVYHNSWKRSMKAASTSTAKIGPSKDYIHESILFVAVNHN